jgi:WXG100 family type VII secretion target
VTRLVVDVARLEEFVAELASFERCLDGAHAELDARIQRLNADWSGVAAAEQAEAHRRWSAAAARMHGAVGTLRQAAEVAAGNYRAAVAAGQQMWSR